MYEVPEHHQEAGSNDEKLDVIDAEIESWVSQDLPKTRVSVEPVSELDYCQIGMTAIVMGGVSAVYALESQ